MRVNEEKRNAEIDQHQGHRGHPLAAEDTVLMGSSSGQTQFATIDSIRDKINRVPSTPPLVTESVSASAQVHGVKWLCSPGDAQDNLLVYREIQCSDAQVLLCPSPLRVTIMTCFH